MKCFRLLTTLILLYVLASAAVYGDLRSDADAYVRKAMEYMHESEGYSAGDERNRCFQYARILFEKALELYGDHLDRHPEDTGVLEPKLTEITSQIFWCNKLTTLTYNHAGEPTAEELMGDVLPAAAEAEPVSEEEPEPVVRIEEETEPEPVVMTEEEVQQAADEARIKEFLARIAHLVKKRRVVEAKLLCKREERRVNSGIPAELLEQVLDELSYVDEFLGGVFETAMTMKGSNITYGRTISNMLVGGEVLRFDKGLLYVAMKMPGSDDSVEIGVPLFSMDDKFLLRNANARTKKAKVGIASFYLLEGNTEYARRILTKLAKAPGEPEDLSPFFERLDAVSAHQRAKAAGEKEKDTRTYLNVQLEYAIDYYKKGKYEKGLSNIGRILSKAGSNMDYLLPLSKTCFKETELYLPEFVKALIETCEECGGKRQVTCPRCNGMGRVKSMIGTARLCPLCKGGVTIPCPHCDKRINSKRYQGYLETLMTAFGRNKPAEETDQDGGEVGEDGTVEAPEQIEEQ